MKYDNVILQYKYLKNNLLFFFNKHFQFTSFSKQLQLSTSYVEKHFSETFFF